MQMTTPIESFKQAPSAMFYWFKNTLLKSNAIKCHILVSTIVKPRLHLVVCQLLLY